LIEYKKYTHIILSEKGNKKTSEKKGEREKVEWKDESEEGIFYDCNKAKLSLNWPIG
jgi:hypothetical protein